MATYILKYYPVFSHKNNKFFLLIRPKNQEFKKFSFPQNRCPPLEGVRGR
jgi:hypothetical protein